MKKAMLTLALAVVIVSVFSPAAFACTIKEKQNYQISIDCCGCWDSGVWSGPPDYCTEEWDAIWQADCGPDAGKIVHYTEYSCKTRPFDCPGAWCYGPGLKKQESGR